MSQFKHAKSVIIPESALDTESWLSDEDILKAFFAISAPRELTITGSFTPPLPTQTINYQDVDPSLTEWFGHSSFLGEAA